MITVSTPITRELSENMWIAKLDPAEVRLLGSSDNTYGAVSVLMVERSVVIDNCLQFDYRNAHVLNVGVLPETLIISVEASDPTAQPAQDEASAVLSVGDQAFLNELPAGLKEIGSRLLNSVRRHYPGGTLRLFPKSGRYVESPDNFWTVKIQPRDGSLRITVRGVPKNFDVPEGIDLRPDQRVYSNFKIWKDDQVEGALSIIRQARKR